MFNETQNFVLVQTTLDLAFFGMEMEKNPKLKDEFEVKIERYGDYVHVWCGSFKQSILMKDTFWMKLTGKTWEEKVRDAEREVFEAQYLYKKENEMKDYQVNRLK